MTSRRWPLPVLEHRLILRPEFEIEGLAVHGSHSTDFAANRRAAMIVPRSRLLFWVAAIVLPFALIAAIAPASAAVALLLIVGFFLVAMVDAVGGGKSLAGIGVELPAILRMSKGREAKVELRIRNEQQQKKNLRLALAWPREIKAAEEEIDASCRRTASGRGLGWPARRSCAADTC